MKLGGLIKSSLLDYPDKLAAVVFTLGCDFRCPWCHNGPLVTGQGEGLPIEEFFEFLNRRQSILDGVVVTGGEPTLHPDLPAFLRRIKDLGFAVKLDSNGGHPHILKQLIDDELIDYIAIDIKAHPSLYEKAAGKDLSGDILLESITQARRIPHEFRLTLVPGIHYLCDVPAYAAFLKEGPLYLQGFRAVESTVDPSYSSCRSFTQQELTQFRDELDKLIQGPVILRN